MTKFDWFWLVLRSAGLYLLVQAALVLPNAVSYTFMLIWMKVNETSDVIRSAVDERVVLHASTYGIQFAMYSFLGLYLITGGGPLLKLANRS